jgi:hypothetical protein
MKSNALHMNADSILVEFSKDGEPVSPGEPGEIITPISGPNRGKRIMRSIRERSGSAYICEKTVLASIRYANGAF